MAHGDVPGLILASTSRYRRELLSRLGLPFGCEAPGVDEDSEPGESPRDLARRLAEAKASAVAARHLTAVVIGSDQTAELDGEVLGKPGDRERAFDQLRRCSGRKLAFHTAVCVLDPRHDRSEHLLDRTEVQFRRLDPGEIARYLDVDAPWDCAGSFKSEQLGVALFERIDTSDPTALVGLPLIALAGALRRCGFALP